MWTVNPFETKYLDQLDRLPPETWQSNAYDLFMNNDWQPWFHSFQVLDKSKLAGFGMLFHFEDVAWLGWLLVDRKYRNLGIGTQIMQHMMLYCKELGVSTSILTATELGAPIYKKLGFTTTSNYLFMTPPSTFRAQYDAPLIRKAKPTDLDSIAHLDFAATAEKRTELLGNHLDETFVYATPGVEGFYIQNLGTGLVIAGNQDAGRQLSDYRMRKRNKSLVIPENNIAYKEYLINKGFSLKGTIPRMVLGKELPWDPTMIYNRAAGYCG